MRFTRSLAVLGDSQHDMLAGYVQPYTQTAYALCTSLLADAGVSIGSRLFGSSGNTSTQALARVDGLMMCETPDVAIIEMGVNDPGNSIVQATTQANIQAAIKALKYGAAGPGAGNGGPVTVATPSALPATGLPGQRYVVLTDDDTTGGVAALAGTSQRTTITGSVASQAQSVWEYRFPQAGNRGWGRVAVAATAPTNCKKIIVEGAPYLNFTAGGDTQSVPYATYVPVRAAQSAAAAAENVAVGGNPSVIYVDLWQYMHDRIAAGNDPDFTQVAYAQATSWHVANSNQHLDAYGHALRAQKLFSDMVAAGWLGATAGLK